MNTRWRKVAGDLREHRSRSLLAVVAIALGALALLAALGARAVLDREVSASFLSASPASAVLWLDQVTSGRLEQVRAHPGVKEADARRTVRARVEVAPGDWLPLQLIGVPDFLDQRVTRVRSVDGAWPPPDGEALVEQSAISVLRTTTGQPMRVRIPGETVRLLPVAGRLHDAGQAPGWQDHEGYAYVSPATLGQLGAGAHLDELHLLVDGDRAEAARVADDVATWLRQQGVAVHRVEVPLRQHPHADHMRTMLALLTVFAVLSLLLSGALVANLMTALLAREVRVMGVMKALGATSAQVARVYLSYALVLAASGIALGSPFGSWLAHRFALFAASQLNLVITSLSIPLTTYLLAISISLLVPLLAALGPVGMAVRRTVREALHHVGVRPEAPRRTPGGQLGASRALILRNLLRRPGRLALTLGALALGGATMMTAVNVYRGLIAAVDTALAARGDDIDVRLLRPADAGSLERDIQRVPGVQLVEAWGAVLTAIALGGPGEHRVSTSRYTLLAPPGDSRLLRVRLHAGRMVEAAESRAVVINRALLAKESGLQLGAEVTLVVADRRVPVRVVGVAEEIAEPCFYTTPATLAELTGAAGTAGVLRVVVTPGQQASVATALEDALLEAGSFPLVILTRDTLRAAMVDHFKILLALLTSAASCAVLVGALGLGTSLSLNVLERSREIGILRALGASGRQMQRMVWLEGSLLMSSSAAAAWALSLPLTVVVGRVVGQQGLHVVLPVVISPSAIGVWVAVSTVLGSVATFLPARAALRLSVRDVLAHE